MTHSDAGRLGAEKTKVLLANLKKQNIEKYNKTQPIVRNAILY